MALPTPRRFRDDGGGRGAARSMETLLRARLDAQVARDRHRDRLEVIDADIRRAEEEGFAADAKVVSARGRSSPPRARARRRSASVRRAHRAPQDGQCDHARARRARRGARTPAAAPEPSPISTFAEAYPPPPSRQPCDDARCETPAWNLRRVRASADATRLEGASCRVTSADDPNPGVPKVPETHPRRASPGATSLRGSRREPSADDDGGRRLRDVARRPSRLRGRRGRWSREGQTPRQIGEGDVAHADGGVCDLAIWTAFEQLSPQTVYLRGCPYQ